jgi:hypothetical protein
MRKRLITPTPENIRTRGEGWLDVERAAVVEVTSEDKDFPVEAAFVSGDARGWRAAAIREVEEYQVELSNVTVLQLVIKPNIGGGLARASLKNLRLS